MGVEERVLSKEKTNKNKIRRRERTRDGTWWWSTRDTMASVAKLLCGCIALSSTCIKGSSKGGQGQSCFVIHLTWAAARFVCGPWPGHDQTTHTGLYSRGCVPATRFGDDVAPCSAAHALCPAFFLCDSSSSSFFFSTALVRLLS